MPEPLDLLYTRDLALFSCEFWHELLRADIARAFGLGLPHHLAFFTGRSVEIYRPRLDAERLCAYMAKLPLSHAVFSEDFAAAFLAAAKHLRELVEAIAKSPATGAEHVSQSFALFRQMYPGYMLAIFVPGAWSEAFKQAHGQSAQAVIDRCFSHRVAVEGLFENWDRALRAVGQECLAVQGITDLDARLLSVGELQALAAGQALPHLSQITARAQGYVLADDQLMVGANLAEVLLGLGYSYERPVADQQFVTGTAAFLAPAVRGRAYLAFRADELGNFQPGDILVAPMTAPDFMSAITKAAAIVTDEGGITCHAAIVARELKKPTIIGTKQATKTFKHGDMIEVDTQMGTVTKLTA